MSWILFIQYKSFKSIKKVECEYRCLKWWINFTSWTLIISIKKRYVFIRKIKFYKNKVKLFWGGKFCLRYEKSVGITNLTVFIISSIQ